MLFFTSLLCVAVVQRNMLNKEVVKEGALQVNIMVRKSRWSGVARFFRNYP